ncbi:hypothetical protein CEH05_09580 [Halobacillus halophilus]|uniref:DUF2332 domain-containing protein n=1 Tax=Halobacillus halophilus (strain ATCC 35676 / DSM 2266 / JCM 20832 / KCTC 3685 / LMG 17431 / NBRC 102448 / NCIMB 2269) TaxID=866895 RepID=I0JMA3_HALH3|nr:DUF2332 domain-containing protein [Halobacillus halophilus]ASF39361.1 hypothetical protein CEH05_09580 [Halobacillus halophilus]CCG45273.1 hypothetical protein HBHAL_2925 [Halobacillus halophilus DSM 2266]
MMNSKLASIYRTFAQEECRGVSRLYEVLARNIAEDEDVMNFSVKVKEGQPVPNLLFGAVHYLLLQGKPHKLKHFYRSMTDHPMEPEKSFPYFKNFCRLYSKEIGSLLQTKLVQTNEVRRCAYLYPVFCEVHRLTKKPLAMIELGSSAGLQLLWDQYSYAYEGEEVYGNRNSSLLLSSEVRTNTAPFLLKTSPPAGKRIGVDLNISDLTNEEEYLWLKALIWPEHHERRVLFEKAALHYAKNPPQLVEGNALELLETLAANVPANETLCIFHTHVANQFSPSMKKDLLNKIRQIGKRRNVFHIYNNMDDQKLHVDAVINQKEQRHTIGRTDGHGRWFEWQPPRIIFD